MPVLCVFAPASDAIEQLLHDACVATSAALGLAADGVIATHVPTALTVRPGHPGTRWPVIVVHGSARPAEQMAAVTEALRTLTRERLGDDEVWVTWQVPQ
jgi:hypothetical protein